MRTIAGSKVAVLLMALAGCASEGEDVNEKLGGESQGIIDGTVISAENTGWINVGGNCSGSLLRNNWVLTAKHCNVATGDTMTMGSQTRTVNRVVDHPTMDITLARVSSGFTMNGSTTAHRLMLRRNVLAEGSTVQCSGYGRNTYTGGFGTLRTASLTIDDNANGRYSFKPNSAGQIQWKGDSGSTCIDEDGYAIIVATNCPNNSTTQTVTSCYGPSSDTFIEWSDNIVHGYFGDSWVAHDWHCIAGEDCHLGDVDGDGDDDLITFTQGTKGDVWVSKSDGKNFGAASVWHGWFCPSPEICRVGDVNGDGKTDIITFTRGDAGDVYVATSNGSNAFVGTAQKWHSWFCVGSEICDVGDVNDDGKADLVAFNRGDNGDVFVATSTGTSFTGTGQKWHDSFCYGSEICKVGDVTGEGRADVIAFTRGDKGDVFVATSNGSSFVGTAKKWHGWFCVGNEVCDTADIDGDNRDDLVTFVRGESGNVYAALSTGTSFLGTAWKWHEWFCIKNEVCRLGDMNGDGRADIMAAMHDSEKGNIWMSLSTRD
jgi:hypothetical protein